MNIKVFFLLLTTHLFCNSSFAQITYYNYFDSTSQWHIKQASIYYHFGCNSTVDHYTDIIHYISGDTLINGNMYHKLYSHIKDSIVCLNNGSYTTNSYTQYTVGLREDSLNRVYMYSGSESLQWDFNVSVGDTVKLYCQVINIDSVWLGNTPLKKFNCDCIINNFFVEGVGGVTSFLDSYLCSIGFESSKKLICYSKQNNLLQMDSLTPCGLQLPLDIWNIEASEDNLYTLFPNPAKDEIDIKIQTAKRGEAATLKLLNVFGELIQLHTFNNYIKIDLRELAPGIYFINVVTGKKNQTKKIIKN